ncbi:transporter associated domain-containing protein, partial [Nitrosopumilus sp.]|nr:transporter associated domain-containing protein [Nitrosopumilus sp.]
PQEGDKIEIEELRIVVDKVSKNIPKKIRIEKIKN